MMIKAMLGVALIALATGPALADVKAGVEAWEQGDYPKAVQEWRGPAIAGDADAQFNLGQAYKLGRGVPPDLRIAEDWFHKAALQNHYQAQDNYGLMLFQNGKRAESIEWIEKSAARGEPRAQYVLGTALFNGDVVAKDWVRAYALMSRASANGVGPASSSLAQMDRYIPADQRQQGLVMARALQPAAKRPDGSPFGSPPVELGAAPTKSPVQTAEVPASTAAGTSYDAPAAKPAPMSKLPVAVKPVVAATTAAPKGWRVQLGAFSDEAKARALWTRLSASIGGLGAMQPYLVKSGAMTRLQAGPVTGKPAADQLCAAVKRTGNPCFPVAP